MLFKKKELDIKPLDQSDSGFTFTELLISCAIMVVLAAVCVPVFGQVLGKVKNQADQSTASAIQTAYDTASLLEENFKQNLSSDFDALTKKLNELGYLEEESYTPQSEANIFQFDADSGKVSVSSAT